MKIWKAQLSSQIKPANFASGLSDELQLIYVLDFGIARKYRNADGTVKVGNDKIDDQI